MNSFHHLPAWLLNALMADSSLALAQVTGWLDPVHFYPEDYVEDHYWGMMEEDPQAATLYALTICRDLFPAVYTRAVQHIRQGASFDELDTLICQTINEQYPLFNLTTIHDMRYGIPVEWYGIDLDSPEMLDQHPWAVDILADFGAIPEKLRGIVAFDYDDVWTAWQTAQHVVRSLVIEDRQPCADLALLLLWLFSSTENSLVDHSYEAWAEGGLEPLEWSRRTLIALREAAEQAQVIIDGALRGLDLLLGDEGYRAAFRHNIRTIAQAIQRGRKHVRLSWPDGPGDRGIEDGAGRNAEPDPAVLLVRLYRNEAD